MTEKLLTFPSPTPSPTPPDPGDGVLRSKFNFFFSTASTQPNTTKDICTGTPCADPGIFCQGGWVCVCVGGGGGSRLLNLFYSLKRVPMVLLHIFQGGGGEGSNFFQGWGPIETHITITCDFPVGLDPLSPLCIRAWTLWHFGTNRLRRACAASF